jgi:hypothetical protein
MKCDLIIFDSPGLIQGINDGFWVICGLGYSRKGKAHQTIVLNSVCKERRSTLASHHENGHYAVSGSSSDGDIFACLITHPKTPISVGTKLGLCPSWNLVAQGISSVIIDTSTREDCV